ncbi:MAG: hypothetical protein NTX03_14330, partial [Bacteroidetes bacterium]|nr:hypothetical protein [Bacteroidota bacterium]
VMKKIIGVLMLFGLLSTATFAQSTQNGGAMGICGHWDDAAGDCKGDNVNCLCTVVVSPTLMATFDKDIAKGPKGVASFFNSSSWSTLSPALKNSGNSKFLKMV